MSNYTVDSKFLIQCLTLTPNMIRDSSSGTVDFDIDLNDNSRHSVDFEWQWSTGVRIQLKMVDKFESD